MNKLINALTTWWARHKFCLSKIEIKCISGEGNPLFLRLEAMYEGYCIGFISAAFMNRHYMGDIPEREAVMQVLKKRLGENQQDRFTYIADIYVEPRYRNCRVGRTLFNEGVERASRMMGGKYVLLGVAKTEQAKCFLNHCGLDVARELLSASIMISERDRNIPILDT